MKPEKGPTPPTPAELLARVEALEREVRAILQARFDLEFPPGHADREARTPQFLRNPHPSHGRH